VATYDEKVLVIDSDSEIRLFLKQTLTSFGYQVTTTFNGYTALANFKSENYDLVFIDVILEKLDGYSVCREIRKISNVPIVILTPSSNVSDRVMGFEAGADDCVIKPFSKEELEFRLRVILDRSNGKRLKFSKKESKILKIQNLTIEIDNRSVFKNGLRIKLTDIEYSILKLLIDHSDREISRIMILENVWGYKPDRDVDTRIVDVNISRLRLKIEETPHEPTLIRTVRGFGYIFNRC